LNADPITTTGIVIAAGFIMGQAVTLAGLPRVTGYILAGILLNPAFLGLVPGSFPEHTGMVTDISLSFITFSVGASLLVPTLRRLGKGIALITLFEAEFAFIAVAVGFMILLPLLSPDTYGTSWITSVLPVALLFGALGSPTDPSATLAVAHQYGAKGDVTRTIMGVSAMDDAYGMVNFSLALAAGSVCLLGHPFSIGSSVLRPLLTILISLGIGAAAGVLIDVVSRVLGCRSTGTYLVLLSGVICICFGGARLAGADPLLAAMSMGFVTVNLWSSAPKILDRLQASIEQLVFVLFFTLSGMHLDFSTLSSAAPLVLFFVILRAAGKFSGAGLGAHIARAPAKVRKYTAPGLIPQGGIVIGLALMLRQHTEFQGISDLVISVILGTVVIHELIGPVLSRTALSRAGEIRSGHHVS
jgi:NhaP-type Na+/H+ or K+/H+ antiporter